MGSLQQLLGGEGKVVPPHVGDFARALAERQAAEARTDHDGERSHDSGPQCYFHMLLPGCFRI